MAQQQVTIGQSLLAGAIAGGVEATITYPTEYVKTQLQLQFKESLSGGQQAFKGPWDVVQRTVKEKGIKGLYRGLSALVTGTAAKASIRFFSFEELKKRLVDESGQLPSSRRMLAGLGAGVIEGLLVVTPTETIKTKLIHDQNSAAPKYKGLVHGMYYLHARQYRLILKGTRMIVRQEGLGGIYRGVSAVILRQGANSAVRLTSYDLLKHQILTRYYSDGSQLPWYISFATGSIAGVITVYSTMPLDVLKTRMQSMDAKAKYKHSLDCFIKTVKQDGLRALWKGATPRLGRLICSGGIVFTVYEQVLSVTQRLERN